MYNFFHKFMIYSNFLIFLFKLKKIKKKEFFFDKEKKIKAKKQNIAFELTTFNIESLYLILISFLSLKRNFNYTIYYYIRKKNLFFYFLDKIFLSYVQQNSFLKEINFVNYCHFTFFTNQHKKITNKLFDNLNTKRDVLNLKYKNFKIGKFIFQTYSREKFKVEIDIKDKILKEYILESLLYVDNTINFFKNNNIDHTFASHGTYIKYNIFNLGALKNKSSISIMLSNRYWSKIRFVSLGKDLYPQADYENFKKNFEKLKDKRKKILAAKKELNKISSGIYKNPNVHKFNFKDTDYNFIGDKNKNKILVLPPCLFDALLQFKKVGNFLEPYTWLKFILRNAEKTNFSWYVKPHPNGHVKNDKIFEELKKKYPKINFLDKSTSIKDFKKANFKSMFTYQSTGAHEYINANIPVVIAEDNVQSSFKFGKPVKNKKNLRNKILKANNIKLEKNDDIYKFYHMFNFGASNFFEYDFINDKRFNKKYYKRYLEYNYKNIFYNYNRFCVLENFMNKTNYNKFVDNLSKYILLKTKFKN